MAKCTRYNIICLIKCVSKLVAGQWFSPGIPFSSTNKTDGHDIAEILLKVALTTLYICLLGFVGGQTMTMYIFSD